ncbi:MAG TPA: exopolysaccharide biosynthesis polyprenyl glycosylphosphotransferase [Opitutaceae bacterium]|nr:exopolysaccharide biosynthesis polyprenyl glycosylphosphotransferase [Opitutaceae bacterium]
MTQGRLTALGLLLLDGVAVVLTFNLVAWLWLRGFGPLHLPIFEPLLLPALLHVLGVHLIDGYNPRTDMMSVTYTSHHTIALFAVLLATLLLVHAVIPAGFTLQTSRFVTTMSYVLLIPVTLSYRRVIYRAQKSHQGQHYFLFLGSPEACEAFKEECRKTRMKQGVLYATHEALLGPSASRPAHVASEIGDVTRYLSEYEDQLDAIILRETSHELPPKVMQRLIELQFQGVPTYTLELFHEVYWRKIPLYRLNQTWLFQEGFQIAREPVFERLKRLSDIVLSALGLLLGLPLLPIIAIAVWLEDRGPVFFTQPRVGKNHQVFNLHKFRTMRVHAAGAEYTSRDDDRITRIGRLLRASRLDELPQLWNVLRGDMSLIGPRAEWVKLVERYEKEIPCYHFRHLVKPGITGWAQINYPYGASVEDTLRKLEYDLYYIRYFSFVLDASIALKTIHVMLFGKGR